MNPALVHSDRVLIEVKTSRTGEETPESMVQFLSSLTNLKKPFLLPFIKRGIPISLEIAVIDQNVHFYVSTPLELQSFIESQLVSQYPKASISKVKDYLPDLLGREHLKLGQMKLAYNYLYPIQTFTEFKDVDPLSSVLGALSKAKKEEMIALQYLLLPVSNSWQRAGERASRSKQTDSQGHVASNPYSKVLMEKVSLNGFKTAIRIAVTASDSASQSGSERANQLMYELANSFSSFNNPTGNSLVFRRVYLWQRFAFAVPCYGEVNASCHIKY